MVRDWVDGWVETEEGSRGCNSRKRPRARGFIRDQDSQMNRRVGSDASAYRHPVGEKSELHGRHSPTAHCRFDMAIYRKKRMQRASPHAQKWISHARRVITHAQEAITHAQRAIPHVQEAMTYAQRAISHAQQVSPHAQRPITRMQRAITCVQRPSPHVQQGLAPAYNRA
jgi:hypothetical protein